MTVSQSIQTKATCKHTRRINTQQHLLKYFPATLIGKENSQVLPQSPVRVKPDPRWLGLSKHTCVPAVHLWPQSLSLLNGNINFTRSNRVILFCKSPWHGSGAALIQSWSAVAVCGPPTLTNADCTQTHFYTPRAAAGPIADPRRGGWCPSGLPRSLWTPS